MKIISSFILFFLYSCGYPDIDSVPNFKDTKLTAGELFDLCQITSTDKKDLNTCLKKNK
mgnify:CR=1 FL=1